jgi:hypothetical protein
MVYKFKAPLIGVIINFFLMFREQIFVDINYERSIKEKF